MSISCRCCTAPSSVTVISGWKGEIRFHLCDNHYVDFVVNGRDFVYLEKTRMSAQVAVIVRGGVVQDIYTDSPASVEVEVFDLDLSDVAATSEEIHEHEQKCARAEEISDDPDWEAIF